jgi:hypothetical protein
VFLFCLGLVSVWLGKTSAVTHNTVNLLLKILLNLQLFKIYTNNELFTKDIKSHKLDLAWKSFTLMLIKLINILRHLVVMCSEYRIPILT